MHHSMLYTPRISSSSSSSSHPALSSKAQPSGHVTKRPKMAKKANSSTTTKQRSVQASLEAKVEKSRGWNAFFVPLARGMPGAPPSSPVMAAQGYGGSAGGGAGMGMGMGMEGGRGQVEHVEHVGHAHAPAFGSAFAPGAQGDVTGHFNFLHQYQSHHAHPHPHHVHAHPHAQSHTQHTSAPASPSSSTIGCRSDADLSRETTRSFASVEEYKEWEKWAKEQWVEHAIPALELGPGCLGMRVQGRLGAGEGEGEGGDYDMAQ